jgi:hypothetical protein
MDSGLLIVSVYRPDIYEEALGAIGMARDVSVVLDRRVGERRQRAADETSRYLDRRRLHLDDQLQTDGWAFVSRDERATLAAAVARRRS